LLNARKQYQGKLGSEAPSTGGKPQIFKGLQDKEYRDEHGGPTFYCSRPREAEDSIPVVLLHPVLGQFVDQCETHTPTEEDNRLVLELAWALSDIYLTETLRREAFTDIMRRHGLDFVAGGIDGASYQTDGDLRIGRTIYLLTEWKNEIGQGGAEPFFEAAFYYRAGMQRPALENLGSTLPCLIMYCFGARNFWRCDLDLICLPRCAHRLRWCCLHRPPQLAGAHYPDPFFLPFDRRQATDNCRTTHGGS
jgi:hypothetical protein